VLKYVSRALASVTAAALLLGACTPASGTPPATATVNRPPAGTPVVNSTPQPTAASTAPATAQPASPAPIKSQDPMTFTYLYVNEPDTLDPAFSYETSGGQIILNTYDTLIFYNQGDPNSYIPQLATEVPSQANGGISADGKTYTFKIRSGVKFHNGDTLTPDDVAFTFQRGLLQGGLSSPQWLIFQPILGLAASPSGNNDITDLVDPSGKLADDKADLLKADPAKLLAACQAVTSAIVADDAAGTATFHLAQPWGPFLAIVANTWGSIVDRKWVGANGGWDGDCRTWQTFYQTKPDDVNRLGIGKSENGAGPYTLDHWTVNKEIVLKAFDSYWRTQPAWPGGPAGAPRLKTIVINTGVAQFAARLAALRAGQADVVDVDDPTDWAQMDPLVGQTCDAGGSCVPAANSNGPLRLFKGLPISSRWDAVLNFHMDTTGGNDFIGSGQLDGNGIPPDFFSDVHVRKAFNYCFNWDAYIGGILGGEGEQSFDVMLPGEIGYSDQDPYYFYDAGRCQAEFQASSLKSSDGNSLWNTGFRFTVAYVKGNTQEQAVTQILSQNLKAVNPKFVMEWVALPVKTLVDAENAHKLPIFFALWFEDIHDPHDWVAPYVTGIYGQQQSLPADLVKQLAVFINQGAAETDPVRRAAIYHQFNLAFYDAAPDILLVVPEIRQYQQRWVQGYYYNPIYSGYYFYALSKQ
jgi:peptide/nickel transport system substrate-binding protein